MTFDQNHLSRMVADLAARPGLHGCALVDASTGMLWVAQGRLADHASLWEAASNQWRVHQRHQAHFATLGRFGSAFMLHTLGAVFLFRCSIDPDLLFIAVGDQRQTDWQQLQLAGLQLGRFIRESL